MNITIKHAGNGYRVLIASMILAAVVPAVAQGPTPEVQQKLAAVKQSLAENQQKLHQFHWTETTQLTYFAYHGDEPEYRAQSSKLLQDIRTSSG